jgi:hypothetical protein
MSGNWDHIRSAVLVLVGPGAVKQRLITAYLEHLRAVDGNALPEEVRVEFAALQSAFNCVKPAGGLSGAEVAVRKMSDQDAAHHAGRIVTMFVALAGGERAASEISSLPRLRVVGDDEDLPTFLSRA